MRLKIDDYKKQIVSNRDKRSSIVQTILLRSSYEDIIRYYDATPFGLKGVFKHVLSYLIRPAYKDLYTSGGDFLKKPIDYVGLMAFVLPLFKKEINGFISLRDQFESNYMIGKYNECNRLLKEANSKISFSLWAATNKIKIAELQYGADKRLEVYNNIVNDNIHPMSSYICNYAQETASIEASIQPFIDKRYKDVMEMGFKEQWQYDYILSLLFPFREVNLSEWISYCMKSSIIDVYCNLIDYLHKIIIDCTPEERLIKYLEIIAQSIQDTRLNKYIALLNKKPFLTDEIRNQALLKEDISVCEQYLSEHPTDMNVLLRYTTIAALKAIPIGVANGSIIERIEYHLYKILLGEETAFHSNKLKFLCLSNQTLFSFKHLYAIVNDLTTCNISTFGNKNWYFSSSYNALDAKFYKEDDQRCLFLKNIGLDPNLVINKDCVFEFSKFECLSIVDGKLEKARLDLEYMSSAGKLPLYTNSLIVSYLFDKYIEEKEYKKAVFLYVDYRLQNPGKNIVVDTKLIESLFTRQVDVSLKCPLELSIFYRLIKAKNAKIAASAHRYLLQIGLERPSEIENILDRNVYYFLSEVVDVDILDLIPLLSNSVNDSIKERILICKKIRQFSEDKRYKDEINELSKDLAVNENLSHVDVSKIDVDVSLLKKSGLEGASDLFDLYKDVDPSIKIMLDKGSIESMFPEQNIDWDDDMQPGQKTLYEVSYKHFLFTQFFLRVRDAFLLDDVAGLDSSLSSRIRHGTVVNQLRTDLQSSNLTTRKNDQGGYDINTHWAIDVFNLDGEEFTKVTEAFLEFTKSVDDQISILKNQKIQVKTETYNIEKMASFDYSHQLLIGRIHDLYSHGYKQYDIALDEIIEDLWSFTEICFEEIKCQVGYSCDFIGFALDKLKETVDAIVLTDNPGLVKFHDTLTKCKTLLQSDKEIVQGWFQRNKSQGSDFDMSELVETTITGLKRITDVILEVEKDIQSSSTIKGKHLGSLYVLLSDIYGNVANYYQGISKNAFCNTLIREDNDILNIVVSNRVSESDVRNIEKDINEFYVGKTKEILEHKVRTEHKSGFYKMNNIVCNYFNSPDNSFDVKLNSLNFEVHIKLNIKALRS